jgi:hypothetical protein
MSTARSLFSSSGPDGTLLSRSRSGGAPQEHAVEAILDKLEIDGVVHYEVRMQCLSFRRRASALASDFASLSLCPSVLWCFLRSSGGVRQMPTRTP